MADTLEQYATQVLKISTKNQGLSPLVFNSAQRYIHDQLEAQLQKTGKVRAVILKGRQQGCSTYVAARFYWQAVTRAGVRVFILTHSQDATQNLFGIVERFHEHVPEAERQPTRIASAKEKYFHENGSGYRVGTAGSKSVGRSQTVQLLHASEVAFWPNADNHFAGMVQTVPDLPGTEIILESTACGIGNKFHALWQEAISGSSEYLAIFIPWYWQEEYRKTPPEEWVPDDLGKQYQALYQLELTQLYWMYCKRRELGSEQLFAQEYPSCAAEAFSVSGEDRFIDGQYVTKARHEKQEIEAVGARVGGCDPARFGNDRTAFCVRQGRVVHHIQSYQHQDTMQVVGLCLRYLEEWKLDKLFIDVVGLGAGVVDRLKELGFAHKIIGVNASSSPLQKEKYHNKRAEMWDTMRQWLYDIPCKLPNQESLHADLVMPGFSYNSYGRLQIEKKENMRKRGAKSPDEADALALTFAFPVMGNKVASWYGHHVHMPRLQSAELNYDMYNVNLGR
jgi:hypothetical protein